MKILFVLPEIPSQKEFFSTFDIDLRWRRFVDRLIGGLEEEVSGAGGDLFLLTGATVGKIETYLETNHFDGLITTLNHDASDASQLAGLYARLPVVGTLGAWVPPGIPYVGLDDLEAVRQLTRHLEAEAFVNPVFLSSSWTPSPAYLRRKEAFFSSLHESRRGRALEDSFLMPESEALRRIEKEAGLAGALDFWWKRTDGRVDSLLCFSDGMARAVLDWTSARGLRVPEDLGVVGIDGAYLDSSLYAGLTTVKMDFRGLGRACFRILKEQNNKTAHGLSPVRRIKGDLIIRRSSLKKSLRLRDVEANFLEGARAYAADHFSDEDPIGDAAKRAGLSRAHFRRKFGTLAGEPYPSFIARLRLSAAAEALRTGGKSITDIATGAGFRNLGHFNQLFKKRFGMSPREFRGGNKGPA